VECLAVRGNNLLAGTDAGVFLTTDNGTNWTNVGSELPELTDNAPVISLALTEQSIFAGTYGQGIYVSSNSGATWAAADSGIPRDIDHCVRALAVDGGNLFAGTGEGFLFNLWGGIYISSNNGACWTEVKAGLPTRENSDQVLGVLCLMVASNETGSIRVFASLQGGGVFVSADTGTTWAEANQGLTNTRVLSLAASPAAGGKGGENLFAGTVGGGVFRSTNGGATWTESGLAHESITCFAVAGSSVFAGTYSDLFVTTDNGASWTAVDQGLPNGCVYDLAVNDEYLFAGVGVVWRRPLSEIVTSLEPTASNLPRMFSLHQNYPNPFNPKTVVSCQLPVASRMRVAVYDLMGRQVAELMDEQKEPGTYNVEFDGTGLSSGMYICRMTAGTFVECRKMVLAK